MASVYRRSYRDKTSGKLKKCKTYTIELSDGQRVKGYTDRLASERKASELETAIARGEQGLLDLYAEHKRRPLRHHVGDYLAELSTAGRDDKYRYNIERRLTNTFAGCGWATLADVSLDSFSKWRESGPACGGNAGKKGRKASGKTINQYLETARAFLNWCIKRGRIGNNPLTRAEKVAETKVRAWRALTVDEARRLIATAPEARRIVYLAAMTTGLRRTELADLTWGDVRLDSPTPFLKLKAEKTKARRSDSLALKAELVAELRAIRPERAAHEAKVFASIPTIEEMREDLKAAEIPWHVPGRGYATFHGLRKTLGTFLALAGVPERVAMEQMRLTDRRLLDETYTDSRVFQLADVVEQLPALVIPADAPAKPSTSGSTGGLNNPATPLAGRLAEKTTREHPPGSATVRVPETKKAAKSPRLSGDSQPFSASVREDQDANGSSAGRTRTSNHSRF
jgi:integrase